MPEGPEVLRITNYIASGIGTKFENYVINKIGKYKNGLIGSELLGSKPYELINAKAKGKLIIITLRHQHEIVKIINTLGMAGNWIWGNPNIAHNKCTFYSKDHSLTFYDPRCFGTIKIATPEEAQEKWDSIGWDLLYQPMPDSDWANLQKLAKLSKMEIGAALMTQDQFSGIGNIYKAEILYDTKINPKTLVKNLEPDQWASINHAAHRILRKSFELGGSSIQTYAVNGVKGSFERLVYKKEKCPVGHKISSFEQNHRTTWFCSECQI